MILALLALQGLVINAGPPDPALPPSDPNAAFVLFRTLCRDTFADPEKFARAIAAQPGFQQWQPASDIEALAPGETWLSPAIRVQYFSPATRKYPLPRDIPATQCHVKSAAPEASPPKTLFAQFAAANGIANHPGKLSGKARWRTEMWDFDRADGTRWRIIFGTERHDGRLDLKLAMLDLGTRK